MALIGTLRNKMTKWVVGFVALSMGAFIVGSDLLGNGPRSILGGSKNTVGEIAGHTISLEEYQAAEQEMQNNYILNMGRAPGERELPTIRQQAWDLLIARYAVQTQYSSVGVAVTGDEIWDMVQGRNIDEGIKQSFLDSAGRFDRERLMTYLKYIQSTPAGSQERIRWDIFQRSLGPGRQRLKYEYLITKTNFVTSAEAEKDYHAQNDVAEVSYLYVPFFALSDSAVKVTDNDLKAYLNLNKEKYKAENTRSMSYVTFPVIPSAEDSLYIREDLNKLLEGFKTTTDDSTFASNNSDGKTAYTKYTVANLPAYVENELSKPVGNVVGPFLEGTSYKMFKIVKAQKDTTFSAKASHILIRWADSSDKAKKEAKDKAKKILADIKGGARFADKAREFGTDGTASRGGDLGWFTTGQMVKPFDKAVFGATRSGLVGDVVETEFGYHIIDVTHVKDNNAYYVATIEREITPSDATQNEAFRKADAFANGLSKVDAFKEKAKKENLVVLDANDVTSTDRRVGTIGEARQMVTWLFREGSIGKVSEVFQLDDTYAVAVMTSEVAKGYKSLDKVRDEITPLVRNQLAGKQIAEKLEKATGTLEELQKLFGTDAAVHSVSDLKLNATTLTGVGADASAIGKAFSVEAGKRSKPFIGENGVVVFELKNVTLAPEIGEYSMFKNQLLQSINGRGAYYISEALKDAAKIEDERYKFY